MIFYRVEFEWLNPQTIKGFKIIEKEADTKPGYEWQPTKKEAIERGLKYLQSFRNRWGEVVFRLDSIMLQLREGHDEGWAIPQ